MKPVQYCKKFHRFEKQIQKKDLEKTPREISQIMGKGMMNVLRNQYTTPLTKNARKMKTSQIMGSVLVHFLWTY